MKLIAIAALGLSVLGATAANAAVCQLSVEANDQMQFNQTRLAIDSSCTDVELRLTHVGKHPVHVMGHNWVLVRSGDLTAVAVAGQNAGRGNNYQLPGDKRIIAATPLVGGGETTIVSFGTAQLRAGDSYSFFCSTPGHGSVMRGSFLFGRAGDRDVAMTKDTKGAGTGHGTSRAVSTGGDGST